jgi:hypothetical protein
VQVALLTNTSTSHEQGQNGQLHIGYCITCKTGNSGELDWSIYANMCCLLVNVRREVLFLAHRSRVYACFTFGIIGTATLFFSSFRFVSPTVSSVFVV